MRSSGSSGLRSSEAQKARRPRTPCVFASVLQAASDSKRGALEAVKPARKEIPYYAEEASPRETCFRRDRGPVSTPLRHAGWRPWSDRARVRDPASQRARDDAEVHAALLTTGDGVLVVFKPFDGQDTP